MCFCSLLRVWVLVRRLRIKSQVDTICALYLFGQEILIFIIYGKGRGKVWLFRKLFSVATMLRGFGK